MEETFEDEDKEFVFDKKTINSCVEELLNSIAEKKSEARDTSRINRKNRQKTEEKINDLLDKLARLSKTRSAGIKEMVLFVSENINSLFDIYTGSFDFEKCLILSDKDYAERFNNVVDLYISQAQQLVNKDRLLKKKNDLKLLATTINKDSELEKIKAQIQEINIKLSFFKEGEMKYKNAIDSLLNELAVLDKKFIEHQIQIKKRSKTSIDDIVNEFVVVSEENKKSQSESFEATKEALANDIENIRQMTEKNDRYQRGLNQTQDDIILEQKEAFDGNKTQKLKDEIDNL